uniref:4Fe-4S dicluster domain-containing protein n=1 Tax=Caldilinea aerophila TaxID=133453 RepID=A0A7C1FH28_9CHLR
MAFYAFLLDLARCIGCEACAAACMAGNELPFGAQYIHLIEQTQGAFPDLTGGFKNHRCYHCADAACVKVCPTGALYKEDGLTRLNREVCIGCAYCVDACPFDVPRIVNGRSSKCDACAATTKAGGQPWCVRTCPSDALHYGERQEILAEAHRRVEAIKARYPKARVYGETEAGGLGVVIVLPDEPEAFGLPVNPQRPLLLDMWQNVVQPAAAGLTGLSVLVAGVAAIIARRNHMKELEQLRSQQIESSQDERAS